MSTMRAARVHDASGKFVIDTIDKPTLRRPTDVLVQLKASGIVPNLRNVMSNYGDKSYLTVPDLPAIYGLDAAGVVAEVGSAVTGLKVGDRVYINPGRSCGSCHACRTGENTFCEAFTFQGYFGFGPKSKKIYEQYPFGGLCEYATAPADGLVKLSENVSFETGARFGYLGTAYSGLRKAGVAGGKTVMIIGGTGTLGLGATLIARAMGATKILVVARNEETLARVKAIDPKRISTFSYGSGSLQAWAKEQTDGLGVDSVIDAIAPSPTNMQTTKDAIGCLRRGGRMVEIGAQINEVPINMHEMMCSALSIIGSLWFTVGEGQDMVNMIDAGTLDLSTFENHTYTLDQANEALLDAEKRAGGFVNVVITQ
ncbi:alcohol dehydrogenase [Paraburkholderia atlantica]|uniref:alcohol dehydrogenase catalytic domain-containing protein n=1 Tax=Paraburkholderia atlantica TaxID=2654982 RepID=UPI003D1CC989